MMDKKEILEFLQMLYEDTKRALLDMFGDDFNTQSVDKIIDRTLDLGPSVEFMAGYLLAINYIKRVIETSEKKEVKHV